MQLIVLIFHFRLDQAAQGFLPAGSQTTGHRLPFSVYIPLSDSLLLQLRSFRFSTLLFIPSNCDIVSIYFNIDLYDIQCIESKKF